MPDSASTCIGTGEFWYCDYGLIFYTERRGSHRVTPKYMIIYSLGVLSIIQALKHHVEDTKIQNRWNTLQVWYANNLALKLSFSRIKSWFTNISKIGTSL